MAAIQRGRTGGAREDSSADASPLGPGELEVRNQYVRDAFDHATEIMASCGADNLGTERQHHVAIEYVISAEPDVGGIYDGIAVTSTPDSPQLRACVETAPLLDRAPRPAGIDLR